MEDRKPKVAIYVGVALIFILGIAFIITEVSNSKSKQSLNEQKIISEKLLSEKLMTDKSLMKLKLDYSTLKEKSDANSKLLAETNKRITQYENRLSSLSSENKNVRSIKKELTELQKVKVDLDNESTKLKSDYEKLLDQNSNLQNSLSSLEVQNKDLVLQLDKLQRYSTDNFLVTATRGKNDKIVARAARTKKLSVNILVPQILTEAISFKIITPSGAAINPDDKTLTWSVSNETSNYTASLSGGLTGEFVESKQVLLTYVPNTKLVAGEYKVQIYCNGNIIGNCRVKLR